MLRTGFGVHKEKQTLQKKYQTYKGLLSQASSDGKEENISVNSVK
jgi:hypothetical protein